MTIEFVQNTTQAVLLTPDVRGSAATAVLRAPDGSTQAEITGIIDSVDTTVASVGSTPDVLTLTSGSNVVVGREYWYTSANGWACKVRVVARAAAVVTLESPPLGAPAAGDLFQGLVFTGTVEGTSLTQRDRFFALDWTVTVGAERAFYRQEAHVGYMRFRDPATPDDAKRIAMDVSSAWAKAETPGRWVRVSEDACARVRELLVAREDYPDLVGDHDAFVRAGEIAVRIVLAEKGRLPAGFEGNTYVAAKTAELEAAVRAAVAGRPQDRDADNKVSPSEVRGIRNIRIERT